MYKFHTAIPARRVSVDNFVGLSSVSVLDSVSMTSRSLGQGHIFIRVCYSVRGGGELGFPACITGDMTSIQDRFASQHAS